MPWPTGAGIVWWVPIAGGCLETVESTYGSDQHGLIWAYLFEPQAAPVAIDSDQVPGWLHAATATAGESFLWLHLSLANAASERWLRRCLALPEAFYDSLSEHAGSTRLEQDGDTLVAVLHDVLFDFTFDPESVSTVYLCMAPRFVVSARLRPIRSVDRLRGTVRAGHVFRSPAELLAQLLHHQAEVLTDISRRAAQHVDLIEDKLLANRIPTSRRELGTLRRTLVRLQRLLAPEPAALFRLLGRSPGWIGAEDLQELRQSAEDLSAAMADSGALVERVKLQQEELAALVGEQTSRTLFVLTVVTVLALPINLVAGLFGMNVGGIPFAGHRRGFLLIVGVLALFTLAAAYLALWRRRE
ncbi:MAG TPA: transporter [Gemmatimonadales bacterium]